MQPGLLQLQQARQCQQRLLQLWPCCHASWALLVLLVQMSDHDLSVRWTAVVLQGRQLLGLRLQLLLLFYWAGRDVLELLQQPQQALLPAPLLLLLLRQAQPSLWLLLSFEASDALPLLVPHVVMLTEQAQVLLTGPLGPCWPCHASWVLLPQHFLLLLLQALLLGCCCWHLQGLHLRAASYPALGLSQPLRPLLLVGCWCCCLVLQTPHWNGESCHVLVLL
jgi:hypothetical protein